MKVVINKCYGGFSLSPLAVKRMAELQGKPCYFFVNEGLYKRTPSELPPENTFLWSAYTVPNPDEVATSQLNWASMTQDEKKRSNEEWSSITLENRNIERNDPILVRVIEELGEKANGRCADLKIVEIPDDVKWEISEYDGLEHVAQVHQTWA